ncbi:hypothetical protein F2Q68_00014485 [Brassica cretica]|uniref:Uncharacterized protein n=2 Tax=Brassica cretica TaxID=69181 RepID=A0A3N6PV72_BRACR|nr:hypothetical protein F2Q68_00014485 [Brassica cretica]KAF3611801.1 hypothetical protein DY000_02046982 [Brassica cretica]
MDLYPRKISSVDADRCRWIAWGNSTYGDAEFETVRGSIAYITGSIEMGYGKYAPIFEIS